MERIDQAMEIQGEGRRTKEARDSERRVGTFGVPLVQRSARMRLRASAVPPTEAAPP